MQTTIHPSTQLDLVRSDAAARQRRAATYRFVHAQRPTRRRRVTATGLITVLLAIGIVGGAGARILTDSSPQLGFETGCADGWYCTGDSGGGVSTAEDDIGRAPEQPLRLGFTSGHADGWYAPGRHGVQVAGVVLERADTRVPPNVR